MKKYNRTLFLILFTGFIGMSIGCKKYFDLNDNPNLVKNPPLSALLSTSTQKVALNTQRFAGFNNYYAQYLASPAADGISDTYQISDNISQWNNAYYAMADLSDLIENAKAKNATEHLGVGQLLMAYTLGLVADTWGSAPYSEAFWKTTEKLTPKFDSEESLYQTSLSLINESITNLKKTTDAHLESGSDVIYQGDKAAWLETAYGIQARFLNKISKKAAYSPTAVLAAVDNSYKPTSEDAGMNVFSGVNPWAQAAINNAGNLLDGWLSENFINQMNGATYGLFDPRIEKITDKTVDGIYIGTRNGQGNRPNTGANTIRNENYISLNSPLTTRTSKLFILTYAEVKFIEAEAAFRLGASGRTRAYQAYLAGIRANMDKLQVEIGKQNTYVTNPTVSVGAANLTLALIFKEKYAALYLSPESWNDMRRNDYQYKDFKLPLNAVLPTFIRRVAYPISERNKVGSNMPAEVPLTTPLWWDKP